ncbi:MAG: T9SS type A sorting domain-containing protein, partial [Saprospiraceae bacterium]
NIGQAGGYIVRNNFISTNNQDDQNYRNRWGFYLHDWESPSGANMLQANAVLGGSGTAFDYGLCAFHFLKSGPWTICGNTTDNTLRGFHIDDNCATSDFAYNIIGHHVRSIPTASGQTAGLLMESDGKLGLQSCRFNQWTLAVYTPDFGAWHKNNSYSLNSIFYYDPSQTNATPSPITPVNGWFVPTTCPSPDLPCHTPLNPKDTLDGFAKKVISENITYKNPENVRSWEERTEILVQMLRNSALVNTSTESSLFYNAHSETSAGLFAQISEMIHNAMSIGNTNKLALDQNYTKMNSVSEKIDSLDGTLTDSISIRHADTAFFSYRSTLLDQLKKLKDNKDSILQEIKSIQNNALQVCLVSNNTLPDTAVYENNQKFLNIIKIKKASGISITDEEYTKLYSIIQQCPEKSGYTRNRAMNFLSLTDPDVSDSIKCDEVNGRTFTESPSMKFKVFPSPAQDVLTIQFNSSFLGNIEIFNSSGIKVLQIKRQQIVDKLQFSVQHLSDGIYFLVCQSETGERFTSRLVIAR